MDVMPMDLSSSEIASSSTALSSSSSSSSFTSTAIHSAPSFSSSSTSSTATVPSTSTATVPSTMERVAKHPMGVALASLGIDARYLPAVAALLHRTKNPAKWEDSFQISPCFLYSDQSSLDAIDQILSFLEVKTAHLVVRRSGANGSETHAQRCRCHDWKWNLVRLYIW